MALRSNGIGSWKLIGSLLLLSAPAQILAQDVGTTKDWPAYGGGPNSIHYSKLKKINRDNAKNLQVAWTFDTGDSTPGVRT